MVAVVWPPVARGDRAFAAIAWLGLVAVLLLIPSLSGLVSQLTGRGPQTLLPSLEAAYPWLLALTATSVFAGLGIARRRLGDTALRRRRLVMGGALGAVFVVASGGLFTVAAVVNELALDDRPAITSRFGPTDPTLTTPQCSEPLAVGPTARVQLQMDAAIDDRRTGQALIDGVRDGSDVRWSGFAASRFTLGQHGVSRHRRPRLGARARDRVDRRSPTDRTTGESLDAQLAAVALTTGNRAVAEDAGLCLHRGRARPALPDHDRRRHAAPRAARGRAPGRATSTSPGGAASSTTGCSPTGSWDRSMRT